MTQQDPFICVTTQHDPFICVILQADTFIEVQQPYRSLRMCCADQVSLFDTLVHVPPVCHLYSTETTNEQLVSFKIVKISKKERSRESLLDTQAPPVCQPDRPLCIFPKMHNQFCIFCRIDTEWRRCRGRPKLYVSFHKTATICRARLKKITYKEKASYGSWPPCMPHTVCKPK